MPQLPFPFDATGKIAFPMPLDEDPRETVRRLADRVLLELSALTAAQRITARAATLALAASERSSSGSSNGRRGTDDLRRSTRDAIEKIGPHCTLIDLLLACDATADAVPSSIVPFQGASYAGSGVAVVNALATAEASNDSVQP